jgi:hypothetical protein
LLNHGPNVNFAYKGFAALSLADQEGHVDIFRELPVHGANVDFAVKDGHTSIVAAVKGHVEVVQSC